VHFVGLKKVWAKLKVKVENRSELLALSETVFILYPFFFALYRKREDEK
jgi:hypothetical protein